MSSGESDQPKTGLGMAMRGLHWSPTAVTTMPVWSWPRPGRSQGGVTRKLGSVARAPRQHPNSTPSTPPRQAEAAWPFPTKRHFGHTHWLGRRGSPRSTWVGDPGALSRNAATDAHRRDNGENLVGKAIRRPCVPTSSVTRAGEAGDGTRSQPESQRPALSLLEGGPGQSRAWQ